MAVQFMIDRQLAPLRVLGLIGRGELELSSGESRDRALLIRSNDELRLHALR